MPHDADAKTCVEFLIFATLSLQQISKDIMRDDNAMAEFDMLCVSKDHHPRPNNATGPAGGQGLNRIPSTRTNPGPIRNVTSSHAQIHRVYIRTQCIFLRINAGPTRT